MAGPVFISHSSRDVKIARGICEAIETRGVACWISGRDVGPGENYGDAIVDAIERAQKRAPPASTATMAAAAPSSTPTRRAGSGRNG